LATLHDFLSFPEDFSGVRGKVGGSVMTRRWTGDTIAVFQGSVCGQDRLTLSMAMAFSIIFLNGCGDGLEKGLAASIMLHGFIRSALSRLLASHKIIPYSSKPLLFLCYDAEPRLGWLVACFEIGHANFMWQTSLRFCCQICSWLLERPAAHVISSAQLGEDVHIFD
jgi:hypothetical protein